MRLISYDNDLGFSPPSNHFGNVDAEIDHEQLWWFCSLVGILNWIPLALFSVLPNLTYDVRPCSVDCV